MLHRGGGLARMCSSRQRSGRRRSGPADAQIGEGRRTPLQVTLEATRSGTSTMFASAMVTECEQCGEPLMGIVEYCPQCKKPNMADGALRNR
jgi:hypothetical protein